MERGCAWSNVELGHLARAWLYASKDAVTGIDQTAGCFNQILFKKFTSLAPQDAHPKTYNALSPKKVRAKFEEVLADV